MKEIQIRKIELQNFKCFRDETIEFDGSSVVSGCNGSGKSTLYDAVLWVLFDKMADGSSATGIRPHDKDGKDTDNVDIVVSLTLDVDGTEIVLTKTQSQKWTKRRGSENRVFEGNVNSFMVNGIPKTQKDFKNFIADEICDEQTFLFCTNVQTFFSLDTKKRRVKLIELTGSVTNREVINSDPEFAQLVTPLSTATPEELMKRSSTNIKNLNDTLKTIPARIDELEKSKTNIDVAKWQRAKTQKQAELDEVESEFFSVDASYRELSAEADKADNELKKYLHKASDEADKVIADKKAKYEETIAEHDRLARSVADFKVSAENIQKQMAAEYAKVNQLSEDWKRTKAQKFDEGSTVCPLCGQEYPEEKKESMKADFEAKRKKDMSSINADGKAHKTEYKKLQEQLAEIQKQIDDGEKSLEVATEAVETVSKEYEAVSENAADLEHDPKYQELKGRCEELQKSLDECQKDTKREELNQRRRAIHDEIDIINGEIIKASRDGEMDARIQELQAQEKKTGQQIADEQKRLDLLERFQRTKMEMFEKNVNKHFSVVKWVLFETLINGGYKDICRATVDGTDMESGLNHGHRILGDIDILDSFQKINSVRLPIFVDDAESLDDWRVPELDTQMILLRRTDDDKLTVKGLV